LIIYSENIFKDRKQLAFVLQQIDFRIASDEVIKAREMRADIAGAGMAPLIVFLQLQQRYLSRTNPNLGLFLCSFIVDRIHRHFLNQIGQIE